MQFANPFAADGNWYKGNLHLHTSNSDGRLSPEAAVRLYQEHGYDFVAITDHNKVTLLEPSKFSALMIRGEEIDILHDRFINRLHLVAIGIDRPIEVSDEARKAGDARSIIRAVKAAGGEVIVAHPWWSMLTLEDLIACEEALALEVYNTGCQAEVSTGYSMVHWDMYLNTGRAMYGVAVDDAHAYHSSPQQPDDCLGGWVMVRAKERTIPAIMESLRAGMFYSTCGPEIRSVEFDGKTVKVTTSPAASITIRSTIWKGRTVTGMDGALVERAEYTLSGQERFIRVECTDARGRMAWANPIIL